MQKKMSDFTQDPSVPGEHSSPRISLKEGLMAHGPGDMAGLHPSPSGWASSCQDVWRACALTRERDWIEQSWGTQPVTLNTKNCSSGSGGCYQQMIQMSHQKHGVLCSTQDSNSEKSLSQPWGASVFLWSLGWGRNETRLPCGNTAQKFTSHTLPSPALSGCGERKSVSFLLEKAVWFEFHLSLCFF